MKVGPIKLAVALATWVGENLPGRHLGYSIVLVVGSFFSTS